MKAVILSVGDELVLGQTVDTNSGWISRQLAGVGCAVRAHVTVADDQAEIERALREWSGRCEALIVTGGLGPTADDLTRDALAGVLGVPLELNEQWIARLHDFFERRGRPMPKVNTVQALIPRGVRMIDNTCGTAPGLHGKIGGTDVFIMPGVPKEMEAMFTLDVLPRIRERSNGGVILSRTLHSFGVGESTVGEMLGELMRRDRNPSVGTTVSGGIVSLRINARFASIDEGQRELAATEAACRAAMGDLIFGQDGQTLAEVVGQLLKEHPEAKRWAPAVCTAESCTGGLLAKMLTDVPGSSEYFRQGWVVYQNEAKINELGVAKETIEKHGAVSEEVVAEMVRGAVRQSGAPYGLAISGVAGPGGGTAAKPVGTVCIAMHSPDGLVEAKTFNFGGDREMVRDRSAKMALTMLRFKLMGKGMGF